MEVDQVADDGCWERFTVTIGRNSGHPITEDLLLRALTMGWLILEHRDELGGVDAKMPVVELLDWRDRTMADLAAV